MFGSKGPQATVENGSLFDNPALTDATSTEAAKETSIAAQPQHPEASTRSDGE